MLTCNHIVYKVGSEENSFTLQQLFSCIPALKSCFSFLFSFFVWSWENSFLHYEPCCVSWVTWPSYPRLHRKGISHLIVRQHAFGSLSKQTVGARLHTDTWWLDPNTFRARSCWQKTQSGSHRAVWALSSSLKDMTLRLTHTPTHTSRGNASLSANGGDGESSLAHREPAWRNMLMFLIFGRSDLDRRNLCFCIYF